MNYIDRGTYGKVFIGSNNTVIKQSDFYDDGYNWQRLKELILLSQFKNSGLSNLQKFEINQEHINITLPDLGNNLSDYMRGFEESYEDSDGEEDEEEFEVFLQEEKIKFLINLIYQITKSLIFLHGNGIIHNDLKPDNIMVRDGKITLIDFGASLITEADVSFCTSEYRSPETYWKKKTSSTSDIWSLGLVCLFVINDFEIFPMIEKFLDDDITPDHIDELISAYLQSINAKSKSFTFNTKKFYGNQELINLVQRMLIFDPNSRITALEIYCNPLFNNVRDKLCEIQIPNFCDIVNPPENESRVKYINTIFQLCEDYYKSAVLALWIMDKYATMKSIEEREYKFLTVGSFILSCSIFYCYSIDLKKISKMFLSKKHVKKSVREVNIAIKNILDLLKGSIYRITFDKILDLDQNSYQKIYKFCQKTQVNNKTQKTLSLEYSK